MLENKYLIFVFILFLLIINTYDVSANLNPIKIDEYSNLEISYISLLNLFPYPESISIPINNNSLENTVYVPFFNNDVFNDTLLDIQYTSIEEGDLHINFIPVLFSIDFNYAVKNNLPIISKECVYILDWYYNNPIKKKPDLINRIENNLIYKNNFSQECIIELKQKKYLYEKNVLLEINYKDKKGYFNKDKKITRLINFPNLEDRFLSSVNPFVININYVDDWLINPNLIIDVDESRFKILKSDDFNEYVLIDYLNFEESIDIKYELGLLNLISENQLSIVEFSGTLKNINGEYIFFLSDKTNELFKSIESNPYSFLLLNKNILIKIGNNTYIGLNKEFGVLFDNGKIYNYLDSNKLKFYHNDIIEIYKELIFDSLNKENNNLNLNNLLIYLIYENKFKEFLNVSWISNNYNRLDLLIKNIEYINNLIDDIDFNDVEREIIRSYFFVKNLDKIEQDIADSFYNIHENINKSDYMFDQEILKVILKVKTQIKDYSFFNNTVADISTLNNNLIKEIFDLNLFYDRSPDYVLDLLSLSFKNYIYLYKNIYKEEGTNQKIINSYVSLIILEETSFEFDNNDNKIKMNRNTDSFSTKKLNLTDLLSIEYIKNNELSKSLVIMDGILNNYITYLDSLSTDIKEDVDFNLISDDLEVDLIDLLNQINQNKIITSINGFNKIQMELFSQKEVIINALEKRKGASEKIVDVFNSTNCAYKRFFAIALNGGYGKDIINLVNGFKNIKEKAEILTEENAKISQGIYCISSLYSRGWTFEDIEYWLDNNKTDKSKILKLFEYRTDTNDPKNKNNETYDFDLVKFINQNSVESLISKDNFVLTKDNKIINVTETEILIVDDFLKDCYDQSYYVYNDSKYSRDVKKLIYKDELEFDFLTYTLLSEPLGIDYGLQKRIFEMDTKDFEFSDFAEILHFIDEGVSPLSITISAVTGGVFGNIIIPTNTFLSGAIVGVTEMILIDVVAGSVLVASKFTPSENPNLTIAITFGLSLGAGVTRGVYNVSRNTRNLNRLSKDVSNLVGRDQLEIRNILLKMSKETNVSEISRLLNQNGIAVNNNQLATIVSNFQARANPVSLKNISVFNKSKKTLSENLPIKDQIYFKSAKNRTYPLRYGKTYDSIYDEYYALVKMHEIDPEHVAKPIRLRYGPDGKIIGYEMEYLNGVPLSYYVKNNEFTFELRQKIESTINKLHLNGYAHGDLNPNNIIILNNGSSFKIIDPVGFKQYFDNFEAAKRFDFERLIPSNSGTNYYSGQELNIVRSNGRQQSAKVIQDLDGRNIKVGFTDLDSSGNLLTYTKVVDVSDLKRWNPSINSVTPNNSSFFINQEVNIVRTSGKQQTAKVINLENGFVKVGFTDLDSRGNLLSYTKVVDVSDLRRWNPSINSLKPNNSSFFINQEVNIVRTSGKQQTAKVISLDNGLVKVGFMDLDLSGNLRYFTKTIPENELINWQSIKRINQDYFNSLNQSNFTEFNFRVNYDQKLPDVFAYPGTKGWMSREVIVFNRYQDNFLNDFLNEVKRLNYSSEKEMMNSVFEKVNKKITSVNLYNYNNGQAVAIGEYISSGTGVCRHRATLLKKAYDEIGIKSALVRGDVYNGNVYSGRHIWVQVKLNSGEEFIVDPMWGLIDDITNTRGRIADEALNLLVQ